MIYRYSDANRPLRVGRWYWVCRVRADYPWTRDRGWRCLTVGVFKLVKEPREGERILTKTHTWGLLLFIYYWLPWYVERP